MRCYVPSTEHQREFYSIETSDRISFACCVWYLGSKINCQISIESIIFYASTFYFFIRLARRENRQQTWSILTTFTQLDLHRSYNIDVMKLTNHSYFILQRNDKAMISQFHTIDVITSCKAIDVITLM